MRRQIDSKSDTCTESLAVDVAGISVKVSAHYPGRSASCSDFVGTTAAERRWDGLQKSAEGIVAPSTGAKART
jgi:hypothetical protein